MAEPLESWGAGEEYNAKVFGNQQGSKLFDLLKHRPGSEWRWDWDEPAKMLELVGVVAGDQAAKKTELEGAVKDLDDEKKLDVDIADTNKAADNKGLLGTAVILAYLEAKEDDRKAEWHGTSLLAKTWMGMKLKESQSAVKIDDYVSKVKEKLFP